MRLNVAKCKFIYFGRVKCDSNYVFGNTTLTKCYVVKYLRKHLHSKLHWDYHINKLVARVYQTLNFVMRNLNKFSPAARATAYLSLVRPLWESEIPFKWD